MRMRVLRCVLRCVMLMCLRMLVRVRMGDGRELGGWVHKQVLIVDRHSD